MTQSQLYKYRAEVAKAVHAMRACGHAGSAEELRHHLTVEALGYDKPSLEFSNPEFDRVLAVIWSHSHPVDVLSQLGQIDQPIKRMEWLAKVHLRAAGVEEHGLDWYIIAIARRMFPGLALYSLTAFTLEQWRDILVACNKHRIRTEKKQAESASHA